MVSMLTDSLLDSAPCAFVSVADDGTMLAVNLTLATTLGYTRAELEGWHIQKILPPGGRIFYDTHVFPILRMQRSVDEIYIALRTRDATDIPMLMNGIRRIESARTTNDLVFVRMIQRHAYEDQLLEARRLAESASESKSRFLSMMSHELRTPLFAVTGFADLLASGFGGDLNDEQREAVKHIRDAAGGLTRLLEDILNFAEVDSGRAPLRVTAVSLAEAIDRAESLVRMQIQEAGLTFDASGAEADTVLADADRLQQIMLNLLTNAIKFTAPGGRITISSERVEQFVRIKVSDTGFGIALHQLERIFDPFVQVENASQTGLPRGVGLGLAISRELARAMGGDLGVSSVAGSGSVFTLELPAASGVAAASEVTRG